jgi:hypothetical protein
MSGDDTFIENAFRRRLACTPISEFFFGVGPTSELLAPLITSLYNFSRADFKANKYCLKLVLKLRRTRPFRVRKYVEYVLMISTLVPNAKFRIITLNFQFDVLKYNYAHVNVETAKNGHIFFFI